MPISVPVGFNVGSPKGPPLIEHGRGSAWIDQTVITLTDVAEPFARWQRESDPQCCRNASFIASHRRAVTRIWSRSRAASS